MSRRRTEPRRVFLRPPRPSDRDELIRLNRASIRFYRRRASPPRTPAQFAAYLERGRQPNFASFLVCRKADGAIVGRINVSEIVRGFFQSAFLGYEVGAAHAGQGYMTEALPLVLRHAFRRLRLHRVEANIQPDNAPSIALVRRAGFVNEGTSRRYLRIGGRWRDHQHWVMLREDWIARARRP
jgi:ribosomal-protein-alanine N-acetyltransferase